MSVVSTKRLERLANLTRMTFTLARHQLEERYAGTVGGLVWLVVHPLVLLAILWFVFSVGFRTPPQGNVPYVLVIFAALIPWISFSEAVTGAIGAISARAYLVRKIAFPLEILPVVPIVAMLVPHFILLAILVGFSLSAGVLVSWRILLVLPYLVAMMVFACGLGLLLSALSVFLKDLQHVLTVVLNIWFWWTPIVWSPDMVPAQFRWIVDANPLVWIVDGYRMAILGTASSTPGMAMSLRFIVIAGLTLAAGIFVFRRLRPHFADVL